MGGELFLQLLKRMVLAQSNTWDVLPMGAPFLLAHYSTPDSRI